MKFVKFLAPAIATSAMMILAAPALADPDEDFNNQLHGYGIYGPRDYNAWLAKIACGRLNDRIDNTAANSAHFALLNLPNGTTTRQSWEFVATAITTYCPEQAHILTASAGRGA
ncbi:hypothetical protein MB901379_01078 [Mycobacterium basiliense]|uniref:DUF732 domain-containing protein n=1 Tax=Mycobacterium basiliense TaxID=2094119 RepID=A0A447GAP4_9MYCO|nr:DUF732 domain-containing protein [Mycobacterium basiliense]VDM87534.1 hypothetical protein MB901379_01078 [Mycobacterium basiliense]